ncbi:MAG: hypothetical protein O7J95_05760 [Planctomycetota bacterium]|nr:hypothetical protein [Planctomycetota bacterium]
MLEVLAGLLGDTRAAGSRQDSTLSAADLRSAVEAARVAFEAQGRLLEALERLEARKPGPRVSEASSPAKLGDHQASLLLELLLRAVKDPRSEALLRALGESEPERPGRPRGGARD